MQRRRYIHFSIHVSRLILMAYLWTVLPFSFAFPFHNSHSCVFNHVLYTFYNVWLKTQTITGTKISKHHTFRSLIPLKKTHRQRKSYNDNSKNILLFIEVKYVRSWASEMKIVYCMMYLLVQTRGICWNWQLNSLFPLFIWQKLKAKE